MSFQNIFCEILKIAICDEPNTKISIFSARRQSELHSQEWSFLLDSMTGFSELKELNAGELFLDDMQSCLVDSNVARVVLIPPFVGSIRLSEGLRREFPRLDLAYIAFAKTIQSLPEGSICAAILPLSGVHLSNPIQNVSLLYHISSLDAYLLNISQASCMFCIAVVKVGTSSESVTRFFKFPASDEGVAENDVMKDFQELNKRNGGKTKYGYVYRGLIDSIGSLIYEKYHPDQLAFNESIERSIQQYGSIRKLSDIGKVFACKNLKPGNNREQTTENQEVGVRLISGRAA
jgi:hypothetical protein